MARINIEDMVIIDRRYQCLGRLLGTNKWEAIGRMLSVWHDCLERETYFLTRDQIIDIHPDLPGFVNAMVESELAEEKTLGGVIQIYIKGTKGRIEWLAAKRNGGKKYGHLGAKYGKKGGRPRKTPIQGYSENPHTGLLNNPHTGGVGNPPPAPAPAPAPALTSKEKKDPYIPPIYQEILDDLNTKLGRKYTLTPKHRELIQARIKEGHGLDDFQLVHANMVEAWMEDDKMREFLRPVTLWSTKFESYLNRISAVPVKAPKQRPVVQERTAEEIRRDEQAAREGFVRIGKIIKEG